MLAAQTSSTLAYIRSEEALLESEKKYRTIVINSVEGIFQTTPEGRYISANPALAHMLGYDSPEELISTITDIGSQVFVDPDDRVKFMRLLRKDGVLKNFEVKCHHKNGSIIWGVLNVHAVRDANGNILYHEGTSQDITDRKQIEEALRESEEKFRDIFNTTTDAIHICEINDDSIPGRFIDVNEVCLRMLRYSKEEMLTKTPLDITTGYFDPPFEKILEEQRTTGTSRFETEHRRKDGSIVPVELNAHIVTIQGKKVILGVARDITCRKGAEKELQIAHEKYTKAFMSVPDAITITDLDSGRFIEVNDAATRIFGYSRDELMGKSAVELGIWQNEEDRNRLIDQIRKHGKVSRFEVLNWRKSGESFNAMVNADTISIENVPCFIAIIRDITDQNRVENALRESEAEFRSLLEHVPELILVHRNGTILYTNPAAVNTLGYQPQDVINRPVKDFIAPEFHERVAAAVRQRMNGKEVEPYEIDVIGKDSRRRNMVVNGRTIEFDGAPASIIILVDITERKRAEEALRESEERYREFFTTSRDSVFITTPEGRWIDFNDALVEMFGFESRKEMFEIPVSDIYAHPEERSLFTQQIIRDGYVKEYPIHLRQKNGTVIDTLITTVAVRNPDGITRAFIGTIRNITEQKQAEQDIHALQQFQQSIIENANVWISVLDPKGTILVWNTTAEQITGYKSDEVIGKNTIWKQLYPEPVYRKQVADNILDIIKKNTYVKNFETRIRTKSGDEKIIWWNTQPMRDASGKPVQFITIGRDNTERRRSEERLRALRQFEESVIKNANIWISVLDGKGNVSVWNRAAEEISGYKADEVVGKNTIWSRIYPDKEYRRTVTATIKEIIGAHKYLENFETRIRTKDGKERIIWWNTRALQDVPGIDETFIAIGKDVTETKTLSDAVQLANKKLNLLSSITRHDILNQLMALKGYLELSGDMLDDPVKLAEFIAKEQNIANTIEDQIQFTKDYEDLGVAAPAWQNVHESVEKAKQNLSLRGIAVESDSPTLQVYADPLLMRVFYNLIDNALKYGGEKMTAIRFFTQESSRELKIICEDDGDGVPADKKVAIFRQGYFKHTGLGLFLSREILAITGITITENGEPGRGARFEITVPKGMWRMKKAGQ
jgi:PAS domain S-box-containing protein